MKAWHGLAFDAYVILILTAALIAHAIPSDAYFGLMGALVGAKSTHRRDGGAPPIMSPSVALLLLFVFAASLATPHESLAVAAELLRH